MTTLSLRIKDTMDAMNTRIRLNQGARVIKHKEGNIVKIREKGVTYSARVYVVSSTYLLVRYNDVFVCVGYDKIIN